MRGDLSLRGRVTRPTQVALAAFLCLLPGCGDGRPEPVPVKGQVLIDGQPLIHGFVRVVPSDGRPAQAKLDEEGRFVLTTFEPNDGVLPGTHSVAVIGLETVSPTVMKWHAPEKYSIESTSGLTLTVDPEAVGDDGTQEVTLELTWDGGQPFEIRSEAE